MIKKNLFKRSQNKICKHFLILGVCACLTITGCDKSDSDINKSLDAKAEGSYAEMTDETGENPSADSASVETAEHSTVTIEKTEYELAMEISDKDERLLALFELIKKEPANKEALVAFLEETLSFEDFRPYQFELSEEFRRTNKEINDKLLKDKNCKYARYNYYYDGYEIKKNTAEKYEVIYYFDENERVIYCPECELYVPSFNIDGEHSRDIQYFYDENGHWVGTEREFIEGGVWKKTSDKALYDDQKRLTKVYVRNELDAQFTYNQDGYVVKESYGNPIYLTYEYKYNNDGYLIKITTNELGEKTQKEVSADKHYRIAYDPDYPGNYDGMFSCYYSPNYQVRYKSFDANGEPIIFSNSDIDSPYDYLKGNVMEEYYESEDDDRILERITLWLPSEYEDGFYGASKYVIAVSKMKNGKYKFNSMLETFRLFYLTE